MTKENLITVISQDTGIRRHKVESVFNSLIGNIAWSLSNGKKVQISGFGTFEPKKRAPRTGRNPHTNEPVPIPARVMPVFRPSNELKAVVSKK